MTDSSNDFMAERRGGQNVSEYRLTRVEDELKDTNRKLEGMDTKLDAMRSDLFERHPFVPTTVFSTTIAAIITRVESLEKTDDNAISNGLIKLAIAVSVLCAIVSPIVSAVLLNNG